MGLLVTRQALVILYSSISPISLGRNAHEADDYLLSQRIVLRRVDSYHLPNALRMTIGSAAECEATLKALEQFMQTNQTGEPSVAMDQPLFEKVASDRSWSHWLFTRATL